MGRVHRQSQNSRNMRAVNVTEVSGGHVLIVANYGGKIPKFARHSWLKKLLFGILCPYKLKEDASIIHP